MNNPTNVTLVYTHAESNGGAHYLHAVVDEIVLCFVPEGGGEAGMVDGGADTLLLEHLCHGFRLAPAHAIDDAAFSGMAGYEVKNCLGFFLLLVAPFYGEAQVGTVERGDERPGMVQVKLPDDIFARDFVGGGGQGDDGHVRELLVQNPHLCVFRPEVMSPLRDAVRFVDGEKRDVHVPQEIIGFCKQLFGRDIQQFQSAFRAGTAQGGILRFVIAAVQRTGADAVGA